MTTKESFSLSFKIGRALIVERCLTFLTRLVDVMMVAIILSDSSWGWLKCIVYVTPTYLSLCFLIVLINDLLLGRGIDLTFIEGLKEMAEGKRNFFQRILSWILERRATIFWIGSWYYLDPDYVTILLRKKGQSLLDATVRITTPSVLISMMVWTFIYWSVYQPFKGLSWAKWLAENL